MRSVLAIAEAELKRFNADKSNIFFVFIFPLALVFLLGSQFTPSGTAGTVAVTGPESGLRVALIEQMETAGLEVTLTDEDGMRRQVARGTADVGVTIPESAAEDFAAGTDFALELVSASQSDAVAVAQLVRDATAAATLREGQVIALRGAGIDSDADIVRALERAEDSVAPARLVVRNQSGLAREFRGLGQFDLTASTTLLLFTFLTALTGAVTLIQARRDGVVKRIMASPVSATQAIAGQGLGRLAIALFQGLYIMLASWLIFGVSWGDPVAASVLLLVFSLVAAGVSMIVGVLVDNESLGLGLGIGASLVVGAIGGAMVPLEFFSDTMRRVAHFTPHAWGYEAFAELQRRSGGLFDILPELGVLLAMAVVTLALGSWLLRRSLERAM
ncbi:MAG: ABC transporter permease [Actinomycetales bacterium]|nr:ABC transporter permease [Tetrasphaera sp.]NLW98351.1 ABC transporter permease [Actinomycetales bacterium]